MTDELTAAEVRRQARLAYKRQWAKEWRKKNPERARAQDHRHYERNREAERAEALARYHANKQERQAANRKWKAEKRDQVLAGYKAYRENHRAERAAVQARRRAAAAGADGQFTKSDVDTMRMRQRDRCAHSFCRASLKAGYHIDHIVPLAKGGQHVRTNIQLLCAPCNLSKGARDPIEHAQRNGMLL